MVSRALQPAVKWSRLIRSHSFRTSPPVLQLQEVPVSNGLILELLRFKDQHSQCSFNIFYSWLKDLYGKNCPDERPPTCKAIRPITKSVRRLEEVFQKLKREKTRENKITQFLKQEYVLPKLHIYKGKVLHYSPVKKFHDQLTKNKSCSQVKVKEEITQIREKMYAAN